MKDLKVIFEDNHLIAVNKPSGVLVHEDETGDVTLADVVKQYIKVRYDKPGDVFLGVIHRLDRPVSGLVLFARTSKALERMNALFHDRDIEKTYLAVVEQRPEELEGELMHYLTKDSSKNIASAYTRKHGKDSKEARLSYSLQSSIGDQHLLKVKPETGRPHQIRVQLAKIGCSIRGDIKYGSRNKNAREYIHLHAYQLAFQHPVTKEHIVITAQVPHQDQVWKLFEGAY